MKRRAVFRVLPPLGKARHGWRVTTPAGGSVICRTKAEAVTMGRGMARNLWVVDGTLTQLFVHKRNGKIAFENSYGRDPERTIG